MPLLEHVNVGDPVRADQWNAIIDAICSSPDILKRTRTACATALPARPYSSFPVELAATTLVATKPGSIVIPGTTVGDGFDFAEIHLKVTEFTQDAAANFFLFHTPDEAAANEEIKISPILPQIPYLLRYEDTDPVFGDMMAPKDSSTALEKSDNGNFIAISDPYTAEADRKFVWVITSNLGKKPLVRFTLDNALATSEASESATITDQYGHGYDADPATTITVHNLLTSTGGVYLFEGDPSDAGYAIWDYGVNYRIIQMECG